MAGAVFALSIRQHPGRCGVSRRDLVGQTDNGGEFLKLSVTTRMCASRPPPTPTRAMRKPCTALKKTSSSISKSSPTVAASSAE
jgi:hypothetical protein